MFLPPLHRLQRPLIQTRLRCLLLARRLPVPTVSVVGHVVATCFQPGGGLEGRHDQYMTDRNRAHAHLATVDRDFGGEFVL